MRILLPLLGALVLVACSSGASDSGTSDEEIRRAGLDPKVKKLVDRASCAAGNGAHATVRFTRSTFDAARSLDEIKQADAQRGCPGRVYSTSKASGAAAFREFLSEEAELFHDQCESSDDTIDTQKLSMDLNDLAGDAANVAVYSSIHDRDQNDDPVHCAYYRFHVYRADGTLAKFDFDWSD